VVHLSRLLVAASVAVFLTPLTAGSAPPAPAYETVDEPGVRAPASTRAPAGTRAPASTRASAGATPRPAASATRPNIVVFYLDDAAPHDARLWNDPQRTPAIYQTFVEHGIEFRHAIGENPLCCPGRAALLTGLHTHNNGVGSNDARLFSPQEALPGALRDVGYTTMWIGKYMNQNEMLSPAGWDAHMAPWTVFDGIYGAATYYEYKVRTKDVGDLVLADVHSTQMVADRAVMRLAAAPSEKPIFAVFSPYDIHIPNVPMPMPPEKMALCDQMQPWWTPAYNEADVSDKPAYVRELPLLPNLGGWPMDVYCREMFGFDQLIGRVLAELDAEGRLDNTLLVFTADNGMAWGEHRLERKAVPYATPVPLYMAWPDRWGDSPRTIDDFVSNIDLAPTVCAVGGCSLGPYPSGQAQPDGVSLLGLLDDGTGLGRDALLEQLPVRKGRQGGPTWAALRTTPDSPLGLWHYVEYETGELELYDLQADPYELDNLAGDPDEAALKAALAARLGQLLGEGRVNRPDLSAWSKRGKYYAGYNLFSNTASPGQTVTRPVKRGTTYTFRIDVENNMTSPDSYVLDAHVNGGRVKVTWRLNGVDVTSQMGGLELSEMYGGQVVPLVLRVTIGRRFPLGHTTNIDIGVHSVKDAARVDHLTVAVRR